jgi:hypothetical protein
MVAALSLAACTPSVVRTYGEGTAVGQPFICKKGRPCEVTITDAFLQGGSTWTGQVDRDPIYLTSDNKDAHIVWKLPRNSNLMFCFGDGVFLKHRQEDRQFVDLGKTGPSVGTDECKQTYEWTALNTKSGETYQYKIVFRDAVHQYIIDPWIVNGN